MKKLYGILLLFIVMLTACDMDEPLNDSEVYTLNINGVEHTGTISEIIATMPDPDGGVYTFTINDNQQYVVNEDCLEPTIRRIVEQLDKEEE